MTTSEEIIAFIELHPQGVTTAMVGDHFRLRPSTAASRCSKLYHYGQINSVRVPRTSHGGWMSMWKGNP